MSLSLPGRPEHKQQVGDFGLKIFKSYETEKRKKNHCKGENLTKSKEMPERAETKLDKAKGKTNQVQTGRIRQRKTETQGVKTAGEW